MEKQIIIDGNQINYDETGPETGPSIILMHGWGCNYKTVRSIAETLENNHHVYNIDLPGHGKSGEPRTVWGVENYTECIEKFIEELSIEQPSLIGHSFGGRVSILLASRNDVGKVVLVDSAGIKPKRSLKYHLKVGLFKLNKKMILLAYGKDKGSKKLDELRSKRGSADYRNSSPIMRAIMSRCVNEDLKSYMPLIKAPTLLIWGKKDTATPIKDAETMNRLIPDSGLVVLDEAGHYSFLDEPYTFKAVLKEFFKNSNS